MKQTDGSLADLYAAISEIGGYLKRITTALEYPIKEALRNERNRKQLMQGFMDPELDEDIKITDPK